MLAYLIAFAAGATIPAPVAEPPGRAFEATRGLVDDRPRLEYARAAFFHPPAGGARAEIDRRDDAALDRETGLAAREAARVADRDRR